jgi:hypothetical protein
MGCLRLVCCPQEPVFFKDGRFNRNGTFRYRNEKSGFFGTSKAVKRDRANQQNRSESSLPPKEFEDVVKDPLRPRAYIRNDEPKIQP